MEYTKSEMALTSELIENCFEEVPPYTELKDILKPQFKVNGLKQVEDIKPTIPPPRLDIAIPAIKFGIRVMGQIHESPIIRRKDKDQLVVLEGNGWTIVDVWFWEREDLWK